MDYLFAGYDAPKSELPLVQTTVSAMQQYSYDYFPPIWNDIQVVYSGYSGGYTTRPGLIILQRGDINVNDIEILGLSLSDDINNSIINNLNLFTFGTDGKMHKIILGAYMGRGGTSANGGYFLCYGIKNWDEIKDYFIKNESYFTHANISSQTTRRRGGSYNLIFVKYEPMDIHYLSVYSNYGSSSLVTAQNIYDTLFINDIANYNDSAITPMPNMIPRKILVAGGNAREPNDDESWQLYKFSIDDSLYFRFSSSISDWEKCSWLMGWNTYISINGLDPSTPIIPKMYTPEPIITFDIHTHSRYGKGRYIKLNKPIHLYGNIKYITEPPKPAKSCRTIFTENTSKNAGTAGRKYQANAEIAYTSYNEDAIRNGGCGTYGKQ